LPDPSDCKVWSLDEKTYQPVIGCDQFQSLLWESAINDSKRVIPILGNNRSGKSYLLNVAKAILPDKTHLKIELASAVIGKMSALAIAELICQKAGVAFPSITSLEKYNTTTAAWLKGEVVEKLINELEKHRTNRLVWLMISDMNHFTLEGENASDFLFLLCERTQQTSWLRVLLDGVPKIPLSLNAVAKAYRTQEIAADDLEAFLERFFAFIKDPPGGTRIRSYASFLFQTYQNDLNKGVSDPLSALSERSQQFISSFLN
jgi:type II secretory pathway predicted ATPase ExeA